MIKDNKESHFWQNNKESHAKRIFHECASFFFNLNAVLLIYSSVIWWIWILSCLALSCHPSYSILSCWINPLVERKLIRKDQLYQDSQRSSSHYFLSHEYKTFRFHLHFTTHGDDGGRPSNNLTSGQIIMRM